MMLTLSILAQLLTRRRAHATFVDIRAFCTRGLVPASTHASETKTQ